MINSTNASGGLFNAFVLGYNAFCDLLMKNACPYEPNTAQSEKWDLGFEEARRDFARSELVQRESIAH